MQMANMPPVLKPTAAKGFRFRFVRTLNGKTGVPARPEMVVSWTD